MANARFEAAVLQTFVLREFRLSAVDADGAVARMVKAMPAGDGPTVPLLTSIDDRRDVATIRAVRDGEPDGWDVAERTGLEPFVSSWRSTKRFVPRIAERSPSPPTHYRLAVTDSGINDETPGPSSVPARARAPDDASIPVDLLWIGRPPASHAGLMILVGDHDDDATRTTERRDWPLSMSRRLGVRIYDSSG